MHSTHVNGESVMVGIGVVLAKETDNYDNLYQVADQALYKAKCDKRNPFYLAKRVDRSL